VRADLVVRLTDVPLDPVDALGFVADPGAGAVVLFTGTVRDHSPAGAVTGLTYEAWEERSVARLEAIGEEMFDRWGACKVALLHRTGSLGVGEVSVIVCCSAAHRREAFEAARHGIERIKEEVPIWKKERLVTGEAQWVMGS
jgi:molybdopterin synthase catalytic subunit